MRCFLLFVAICGAVSAGCVSPGVSLVSIESPDRKDDTVLIPKGSPSALSAHVVVGNTLDGHTVKDSDKGETPHVYWQYDDPLALSLEHETGLRNAVTCLADLFDLGATNDDGGDPLAALTLKYSDDTYGSLQETVNVQCAVNVIGEWSVRQPSEGVVVPISGQGRYLLDADGNPFGQLDGTDVNFHTDDGWFWGTLTSRIAMEGEFVRDDGTDSRWSAAKIR